MNTLWFLGGAQIDPMLENPQTPLSYTASIKPWELSNRLQPKSGSPAIDSGQDPRTATGMNQTLLEVLGGYLSKDVAGNNRINGNIDIGAYEHTSATPTCTKQGDINCDNAVNIFDLSILLSNYSKAVAQATNARADVNGNGTVDIFDLSILLSRYGT